MEMLLKNSDLELKMQKVQMQTIDQQRDIISTLLKFATEGGIKLGCRGSILKGFWQNSISITMVSVQIYSVNVQRLNFCFSVSH